MRKISVKVRGRNLAVRILALLVQSLLAGKDWVRGHEHAKVAEDSLIHRTQDGGGVNVATNKFLDLLQRLAGIVILRRRHGQGDQHLVGMQAWIFWNPGAWS